MSIFYMLLFGLNVEFIRNIERKNNEQVIFIYSSKNTNSQSLRLNGIDII